MKRLDVGLVFVPALCRLKVCCNRTIRVDVIVFHCLLFLYLNLNELKSKSKSRTCVRDWGSGWWLLIIFPTRRCDGEGNIRYWVSILCVRWAIAPFPRLDLLGDVFVWQGFDFIINLGNEAPGVVIPCTVLAIDGGSCLCHSCTWFRGLLLDTTGSSPAG